MNFTASQIAQLINGEIIGNPSVEVNALSKIEEGKEGTISFIAQEKFAELVQHSHASIIVISRSFVPKNTVSSTLIVVDEAYMAFNKILQFYAQFRYKKSGIETPNFISEKATLGTELYIGAFTYISDNVTVGNQSSIYPNCYIGNNVTIGENVMIEPNVVIYDDCVIGNNCIIHSGSIIGSDGFGFAPTSNGLEKVPQLGNVILENDVEIGSNCTIDRATIGSTVVKQGTKLDNLIQIAHNVEIGENNVIAAQTGIAGSTKIGNWNMIGGQVGIAGHITIGNQIKIQGQSGINKSVSDNETLFGSPAIDAVAYRKSYVHYKNLPNLVKRIEELEKLIHVQNSNNGI